MITLPFQGLSLSTAQLSPFPEDANGLTAGDTSAV